MSTEKMHRTDAARSDDIEEAGIRFLDCCGERLRRWREKGSAVFEAECGD